MSVAVYLHRWFNVSHTGSATPKTKPASVPLRFHALFGVLALLCLHASPAKADIWGYLDTDRMPHFASSRLDERYELLLKDSDAVEPYRPMAGASPAQREASKPVEADMPEVVPFVASAGGARAVSPRLLEFFERSSNYKAFSPLLREASKTHGIDYSLLQALISTESGFNAEAVSPKGAVGLMQVMPPTAERYGVTASKNSTVAKKLTNPKVNIKAGARYLADLIKMFPGRLELALAAYNAGEGAVQRAGNKIPNYPETQKYVKTVMQLYTGLEPSADTTVTASSNGRVRVEIGGRNPARKPTVQLAESRSSRSR
ncbi:lytic transglycosylase domain-containing protein [Polaromonas sp. A23]|uniref:lytic transglycosylase domain-containing protein n=1 Tax=Polaromonas sp. A23 TaxID=1944133 RepID=UPI000986A30D|nr:lytic transglycosylase domain-containing protein [Polaromonas sp. A23]